MLDKNLGTSGLRVSTVGLGCNNFGLRLDLAGTKAVVHKALDEGITLFDTADMYGNRGGSETLLGEALGERRKDIVLASKFGMQMDEAGKLKGGSRRYIMAAVEASLKRLRTDWIDLYQLHRPDPLTPIEETLRALDDLVRQGKVRYIGCSNLAAWQVVEAAWTAKSNGLTTFVSCQDEYSLLHRKPEADLVPVTQRYGLGILPFYPLAAGLLTGKHQRGHVGAPGSRFAPGAVTARYLNDKNWDRVEQLQAFVAKRGHTMVELAFSWLASRPTVSSVIAGATTPEQVAMNVKAASWALSADELQEIDKITA